MTIDCIKKDIYISKINRNCKRLFHKIGRLALSALLAGSLTTLSKTPVKADAGDLIGGIGLGIILNEALRNDGAGDTETKQNNTRQEQSGGSKPKKHVSSPAKPRYTKAHKTQKALADLGFYTGAINGANGPNTRAAISQYQASKYLPQTGVLTDEQHDLMIAEAELQTSRNYLGAPNMPPLPSRDHKRRIQAALKVLGHYNGSIDGIFGNGTARAVSSYQRTEGYPVTGLLSPEQEDDAIKKAYETLNQRLAGINDQFAIMSGRPATGITTSASPVFLSQQNSQTAEASQSKFPQIEELNINIAPKRKYDVAVVIGNKAYAQDDIPDVVYGERDAKAIRAALVNDLGFNPENIILAENASQAEMRTIFGSENNIKGKLWRYIDPEGQSNVVVYYSGHGAPDINSSAPYLLPVDTDPNSIALNGYSLDLMYQNLSKLPVKSVAVMIDACFSGGSHKGMLIKSASPVMVSPKLSKDVTSEKLTVLTAADGNELASWDEENGHGMFTTHLLSGMKGAADANGDKKITARELYDYVRERVRRQARREFGREQTPKLMGDPERVVSLLQ